MSRGTPALPAWARDLWEHLDHSGAPPPDDLSVALPVWLTRHDHQLRLGGLGGRKARTGLAQKVGLDLQWRKSEQLDAALRRAAEWLEGRPPLEHADDEMRSWYDHHQRQGRLPKCKLPTPEGHGMEDSSSPLLWALPAAVALAAVAWFFYSRRQAASRDHKAEPRRGPTTPSHAPAPPTDRAPAPQPVPASPQGARARGGVLIIVLQGRDAGDLVPEASAEAQATAAAARSLLDRYQSIGFVQDGSAEAARVVALDAAAGPPTATGLRVAVIRVEEAALALDCGARPDRAYERRLVAAADRGELTIQWRAAAPADLADIPLVGQF